MTDSNTLHWPTGRIDFSKGTVVMGILNVTPDSFSDGGEFLSTETAVSHALNMVRAGAFIIDVGPESTRPGAETVNVFDQLERCISVIENLSDKTDAVISVDTRLVDVASAALDAGASMVNDISALEDDHMAKLIADRDVPVVLMHMLGDPMTMQINPQYDDVTREVLDFLMERAQKAQDFGVPKERIFIDPGIGFGKSLEHNLQLMRDMHKFVATGYKLLMGTSRKRFVGMLTEKYQPSERLFGTAATVAISALAGASIVRVHDVAEMVDVVNIVNAINK